MRSFALAFASALLLSPISVLATYGEHGHHPDHPDHPDHSHHSHKNEHAISNVKEGSTTKTARIAIHVVFPLKDVDYICNREEDTCLEENECYEKRESCSWKNKCQKKKKECFKNYKCPKKAKICHKKATKKYGFRCGKKFYNRAKIIAAAKAACKKIDESKQEAFPAHHTAYDYDVPGPYYEWPISRNRKIHRRYGRSKERIVMTSRCDVIGAVIRHSDKSYSQCRYERY